MLSVTSSTIYANIPDAINLSTESLQSILSNIKAANVKGIRIRLPWNAIQPTNKTNFSWVGADRVINACIAAGFKVMIVLAPPKPSWTPTINAADFTAFAVTAANRYKAGGVGVSTGKVDEIQLWDEPNANWPLRVSAAEYAAVVRTAYPAIKKASTTFTVVLGGLQACQTSGIVAQEPVAYLKALYSSKIKGFFDVLAYHPLSLPTAQFPNPTVPSGNSIKESDSVYAVLKANEPLKSMYWTAVGYDAAKVTPDQHASYLDALRWFAEERKNYVSGIAVNWLTESSFDAAAAQIRRWNDRVRRHTIFTVCGTQDYRHKLFTWSGTTVPNGLMFQAMVGTNVDKSIWEWVQIDYPHWLPVYSSVAEGVANGIAAINAWPGKFAFSGYSQGAIVASNLLWEMKFGSLQHRYKDLIGGVMFGNPCREANVTFPGGINPGGSGMAPDSGQPNGRVRNTPSFWWEFANSPNIPGVLGTDNFTVNPLTSAGTDITAIYQMMLGEFTGASYDIFERARQVLNSETRVEAIRDAINAIKWTIEGSFAGHAEYGWSKPLAGSNLTSVQLGIQHLNNVGRQNPTGASPDNIVGRLANSDLYNWVPISYPISLPIAEWSSANVSLSDAVRLGVNQLVSLIRSTPGTFALVGMSQGSVVASQVLKALLPGGALANRYNDCIAGVAFGNPCRKQGSAFPGGAVPSGAGCLSPNNTVNSGLSGLATSPLPPWWWEMAATGDFYADAPMSAANGAAGITISQAIATIYNLRGVDFAPMGSAANIATAIIRLTNTAIRTLLNRQAAATITAIGLWLRDQGFLAGVSSNVVALSIIRGLLGAGPLQGLYSLGNPHTLYGSAKPPVLPTGLPGLTSNSTYSDVAAAYINKRGLDVLPR